MMPTATASSGPQAKPPIVAPPSVRAPAASSGASGTAQQAAHATAKAAGRAKGRRRRDPRLTEGVEVARDFVAQRQATSQAAGAFDRASKIGSI